MEQGSLLTFVRHWRDDALSKRVCVKHTRDSEEQADQEEDPTALRSAARTLSDVRGSSRTATVRN
jgi:hypothetical protein